MAEGESSSEGESDDDDEPSDSGDRVAKSSDGEQKAKGRVKKVVKNTENNCLSTSGHEAGVEGVGQAA